MLSKISFKNELCKLTELCKLFELSNLYELCTLYVCTLYVCINYVCTLYELYKLCKYECFMNHLQSVDTA